MRVRLFRPRSILTLAAAGSFIAGAGAATAAGQSHDPKDLAAGKLLIASAQATDGRFQHTVILLLSNSAKSTAGIVINQPGKTPLAKLFPKIDSAQGRTDLAYDGGPVEPARIFCLLRLAGPLHEAQLVLPGVYVSDNQNLFRLAFNAQQPASSFRVFQGYAGWEPGQLPRELAAGLWTILPATPQIIFDPDPSTLWPRLDAQAEGRRSGMPTAAAGPTPRDRPVK